MSSETHEGLSLMEFLEELVRNVGLRDLFTEDPSAALAHYGLDDLTPADVHDALILVEDNQTADFSRSYDTGADHVSFTPPPVLAVHDGDDHQAAVAYLNTYLTNNHVDDRDTVVDLSLDQQVDTGGGDFDQYVDIDQVTASGDGAVVVGGDVADSVLVGGDGNQVGDGNVVGAGNVVGEGNQAVTGHGNVTSFGDGDAAATTVGGHLTVGAGAGFATGGSVAVDNSDNSRTDVDNDRSDNSRTDVDNDYSDNADNSDDSETDVGNDFSDNSDNSDNSTNNVGNVDLDG